jgi:hypothetical protein
MLQIFYYVGDDSFSSQSAISSCSLLFCVDLFIGYIVSPDNMALNLAISTRLEQRLRQLRDWIWGRQMTDEWRDQQAAGWGPDYDAITLRTSSQTKEKSAQQQQQQAAIIGDGTILPPGVNATNSTDSKEEDTDDPAIPHVLINYRPRLSPAQEVTHKKCLDMVCVMTRLH